MPESKANSLHYHVLLSLRTLKTIRSEKKQNKTLYRKNKKQIYSIGSPLCLLGTEDLSSSRSVATDNAKSPSCLRARHCCSQMTPHTSSKAVVTLAQVSAAESG